MTNVHALDAANPINPVTVYLWQTAATIADLPIEDMLEKMLKAETITLLLDPTLWMCKRDQFYEDKAIVEAALTMKRAFLKIKAEHDAAEAKR